MDDLNNDLENNNFENDNDADSQDDSDDECTYARFDFESFDLDEFLRRLESPSTNRKRNLYEAPEFVQRLKPFEEARAGSTVVFECKWKGCPKPSVKWYKDDEEITENPRYSVTEENDGLLKLTIEGACKEDEGAYKVKAENSEGVSSSTGYLSVTGDVSDRPLAAQPRKNLDHSVSFPPHLRTIVEQKSLEEREAEELSNLPPSPIQGYIDSFRRGQIGPLFPGCTVPSYADDEGDSMEQDDSDSDTSVDSQTFGEELFITEDDDDINAQNEASDPLLPERERPLQISLDYSKLIEPLSGNSTPDESLLIDEVDIENEVETTSSSNEVLNIVELPTETSNERLAEHFEEFMKSKRKNVDENVGQNVQECTIENLENSPASLQCDEKTIEPVKVESYLETTTPTTPSTKLPDIIQTVAQGNKEIEEKGGVKFEDKYISATFMHVPKYENEIPPEFEPETEECVANVSTSENQSTPFTSLLPEPKNVSEESSEITYDLPWLCYLGLAAGSTFLASYTNMSPFYYVLLWVAISFFSFQFCVKEERVTL